MLLGLKLKQKLFPVTVDVDWELEGKGSLQVKICEDQVTGNTFFKTFKHKTEDQYCVYLQTVYQYKIIVCTFPPPLPFVPWPPSLGESAVGGPVLQDSAPLGL